MKLRIIYFLILLGATITVGACKKRVTPRKVEKNITLNKWYISSYQFADSTLTEEFSPYQFSFGEDGEITIYDLIDFTGTWVMGESKKPTLIFFTFPNANPFNNLSGDWKVDFVSETTLDLTSNSSDDLKLTFNKVEE